MISGKARLAGVGGWPIGHSRSPRLHGHWLARYGIDGCYLPLPIAPADLADALRILPRIGFAGLNLTVPHKEAALALCDSLDAVAQRIGAVNTLIFKDGKIEGRNTDAFGFMANLLAGAPDFRPARGPAVILGAGGGARAVAVALQDLAVPDIRLVNRDVGRAERLAAELGAPLRVMTLPDALDGAALVVNATSLGMIGQPRLELALEALSSDALVTDLVYVPLETELLGAAAKRGNPVVDGVGMLLHQGRPGFEAWFGVLPEVTADLRTAVLAGG